MKKHDPSLFTRLVATVFVNAGQDNTERIGELVMPYEDIEPSVKEVCRKIVFQEFDFKDEYFKGWHRDSLEDFPTECAQFVSFLISFYESNLKIDNRGFYIASGVLGLSKKRLSAKDLWDYYERFDNDRDIHPLATWKDAIVSEE
jgi:hypothetical protein